MLILLTSFSVEAFAQDDFAGSDGSPSSSAAQGEALSGGDDAEVEALYDKQQADESKKAAKKREEVRKPELKDATTLSELANLAPFSDVAVIQRRFLPRTGRFELSGSGLTSINNPFFNNLGLALRGAYYLREKHGIELQYMFFSSTRRDVTVNLEEQREVRTSNLVTAKSYMGAAYKWTPWYGKITFMNRVIVPFDFYFNVGGGLSKTDNKSEPTVHLGTGQSYAISKGFAVRWDLVWNFYQAETESVAAGGGTTNTAHNDLFLSAGVSFFFPEATYR
jgi:outer membrane beta-barrel protein